MNGATSLMSDGWVNSSPSTTSPVALISAGWIAPEIVEPEFAPEPEVSAPIPNRSVIGGAFPFHPLRRFYRQQRDPFSILAEKIASSVEFSDAKISKEKDKAAIKASDRVALVVENMDDPVHAALLSLGRALEDDS